MPKAKTNVIGKRLKACCSALATEKLAPTFVTIEDYEKMSDERKDCYEDHIAGE